MIPHREDIVFQLPSSPPTCSGRKVEQPRSALTLGSQMPKWRRFPSTSPLPRQKRPQRMVTSCNLVDDSVPDDASSVPANLTCYLRFQVYRQRSGGRGDGTHVQRTSLPHVATR